MTDDAKIVNLADRREQKRIEGLEFRSGPCVCMACRHRWEAENIECGLVWIPCPLCTLLRGTFYGPTVSEKPHWTCACGNFLFMWTEDRIIYCPNCGQAME